MLEREVEVHAAGAALGGTLALPDNGHGVVLFAHGSGSSRHSPRNRRVADVLHAGRIGTLLFDLLTRDEETIDFRTRELRFDIGLLSQRLVGATDWLASDDAAASHAFAYFGASTGAAAALVAAAERRQAAAVVSRGGRPDLAGEALRRVTSPTLLIVGSRDELVLDLNRQAMSQMDAPVELEIVPGASHLFEEPGALEEVARLARTFLERFL